MAAILFGITGSVAAYRSPDLVKELVARGHKVQVVLTASAAELVSDRVLETFSGRPVLREHSPESSFRADIAVVYAATADFLYRYAYAAGTDRLLHELLKFPGPVWLVPAMNPHMWEHPAVQSNVKILSARGVRWIGPVAGRVACGEEGVGHVASSEEVLAVIERQCATESSRWKGRGVLISAGPMRSSWDAVRYLQNRSSGRMGIELAKCAASAGAHVHLLLGPIASESLLKEIPEKVPVTRYVGVQDYGESLRELFPRSDLFISAAAVLDFEIATISGKYSRDDLRGRRSLEVPIVPTLDWVAEMASLKRPEQRVVAFAAESGTDAELLERAREKWRRKKVDALAANPVNEESGPEHPRNRMWWLTSGATMDLGEGLKSEMALRLWKCIDQL